MHWHKQCAFKKIDINAKTLISIHKTHKKMINFNPELKKLAAIFPLPINKMLILLLKIKQIQTKSFDLVNK